MINARAILTRRCLVVALFSIGACDDCPPRIELRAFEGAPVDGTKLSCGPTPMGSWMCGGDPPERTPFVTSHEPGCADQGLAVQGKLLVTAYSAIALFFDYEHGVIAGVRARTEDACDADCELQVTDAGEGSWIMVEHASRDGGRQSGRFHLVFGDRTVDGDYDTVSRVFRLDVDLRVPADNFDLFTITGATVVRDPVERIVATAWFDRYDAAVASPIELIETTSAGDEALRVALPVGQCAAAPGWGTILSNERLTLALDSSGLHLLRVDCIGDGGSIVLIP